nr:hypothetical protein [uncultured Sphaerochaeta sp.]
MENKPYRVLYDYGSYEGMKFANDKDGDMQFATAEEALKWTMEQGYTAHYKIVKVVEFKEEV